MVDTKIIFVYNFVVSSNWSVLCQQLVLIESIMLIISIKLILIMLTMNLLCSKFSLNTFRYSLIELLLKGATKLYFTHDSYVVIILFNTGLQKPGFSTDSFGKLFCLSRLFVFRLFCVEFNVTFTNFINLHNHCLHNRYQVLCVFVLIY